MNEFHKRLLVEKGQQVLEVEICRLNEKEDSL